MLPDEGRHLGVNSWPEANVAILRKPAPQGIWIGTLLTNDGHGNLAG